MSTPAAASSTVTPGTSDALDSIQIGRVDSYKKLDKIGVGSFGDVWKARHRRSGKKVAVKSVRTSEESLLREAALLAACMGNPAVVEFREVVRGGKTDKDKLYLVMEYAGRSLHYVMGARRRDGRPFTEAAARRIMRQLLGGVEIMHDHGVVHCDLKPANVLVGKEDGRGPVLKICDLGHARSVTVPSPDTSRLVVGTLGYMAPEQLMGDMDCCSTPVDMWSLGCVMAELVSGKPIFKVEVSECEHLAEIVHLLCIPDEVSLMPLGVSASTPSQLRDAVPEERLSMAGFDVLRGLLEFDPRDRLTAAAALQMPWFTVEDDDDAPSPATARA
jgi:cyclin-dependent kinase/cell division cycle 2-like protein